MSFTGNLGVTHGGIFIAHSHGMKEEERSKKKGESRTHRKINTRTPPF
jgi:hypothetical protein